MLVDVLNKFDRNGQIPCPDVKLVFAKGGHFTDLLIDPAHMPDSLDHISRAGLTLGPYHHGSFGQAAQRLIKAPCAANKRYFELGFINVIDFVGRRQHFAFIHKINADRLKDLCFNKVADTDFRHHRNPDRLHDGLDHGRVTHS